MALAQRCWLVLAFALMAWVSLGCQAASGLEGAAVTTVTPEPVVAEPTMTEETALSLQATGTAELPSVMEQPPSGDPLPADVVHHVIAAHDVPSEVPPDVEWRAEEVVGSLPDRRWVGIFERSSVFQAEGHASAWVALRLRIADAATQATRVVVDSIWAEGIPSYAQSIQRWSEGEDGVYFGYPASGDGCAPFGAIQGLYEVTLPVGELVELVESDWRWNVIGVSPDEQQVAYQAVGDGTAALVVRDLASGAERQFELTAEQVGGGSFTWSPDSRSIAFVSVQGVCEGGPHTTTVFRASLTDGTISEIGTYPDRYYTIASWLQADRIVLRDQAFYWLNTETGEIKTHPN